MAATIYNSKFTIHTKKSFHQAFFTQNHWCMQFVMRTFSQAITVILSQIQWGIHGAEQRSFIKLLFKYAKCNYDNVVIIEKNSFNQIQIQHLFLPLKTSTQCPPIYTPILITWCSDNLKASLLHLWKHADLFGDLFDSWSSWILYMYRKYFLFILGSLPLPS